MPNPNTVNDKDKNGQPVNKGRYLTTGEKIRNFTGWAFLIAICLELIALPFYHQYGHPGEEQTEKPITIERQTIKPPPTPPPPTPTPPPTPVPQQTPQHHVVVAPRPMKITPPKVSHVGGSGPAQQTYHPPKNACSGPACMGQSTSTAPPQTAPPATPASCPDPNREAHTVELAQPDYPESASELGLGPVEVTVVVTIGPDGQLVNATIASDPSHNSAIEHEALRVARTTTYAPHLVDCKPVTDDYRYVIDFNPD